MFTLVEPSYTYYALSSSLRLVKPVKWLIIWELMLLAAPLGNIRKSRIRNNMLLFLSVSCLVFASLGFTALVVVIVFLFFPFQLSYICWRKIFIRSLVHLLSLRRLFDIFLGKFGAVVTLDLMRSHPFRLQNVWRILPLQPSAGKEIAQYAGVVCPLNTNDVDLIAEVDELLLTTLLGLHISLVHWLELLDRSYSLLKARHLVELKVKSNALLIIFWHPWCRWIWLLSGSLAFIFDNIFPLIFTQEIKQEELLPFGATWLLMLGSFHSARPVGRCWSTSSSRPE